LSTGERIAVALVLERYDIFAIVFTLLGAARII
jgi:hypothetical protein